MSTIKSSAESLTLNADGSGNDIIIQSNGSTKVIVDGASGAVGVGVTPTSNGTLMKQIELGAGSILAGYHATYPNTYLGTNVLFNSSGNMVYKLTDQAAMYYQDSAGIHRFQVAASGSANSAITFTTGFEVLNDGKARAKNGLLFGTDTAAANALDDYEEGFYDVAVTSGSGTITIQANQNRAWYTKIGRMVTCGGRLEVASVSSPSGQLYLSLPFNVAAGGEGTAMNAVSVNLYNLATHITYGICAELTDANKILIRSNSGSSDGVAAIANLIDADSLIGFTATYPT